MKMITTTKNYRDKKENKLVGQLFPDHPHILCFTKYHLNYLESKHVCTENYNLGEHY
jgi:hypothetical protein